MDPGAKKALITPHKKALITPHKKADNRRLIPLLMATPIRQPIFLSTILIL